MLWFFERQDAWLRYEIRRQAYGYDYELVITHPDGHQDVERFGDSHDVIERSRHLQEALVAAGWHAPDLFGRSRNAHGDRRPADRPPIDFDRD